MLQRPFQRPPYVLPTFFQRLSNPVQFPPNGPSNIRSNIRPTFLPTSLLSSIQSSLPMCRLICLAVCLPACLVIVVALAMLSYLLLLPNQAPVILLRHGTAAGFGTSGVRYDALAPLSDDLICTFLLRYLFDMPMLRRGYALVINDEVLKRITRLSYQ